LEQILKSYSWTSEALDDFTNLFPVSGIREFLGSSAAFVTRPELSSFE
jgi:hypothetical protein